ncbi:hypothetical protein [Algoriphagus alkaliphilus]|nr:hypothetical protein [Algoriphagus alkaliphilus]
MSGALPFGRQALARKNIRKAVSDDTHCGEDIHCGGSWATH